MQQVLGFVTLGLLGFDVICIIISLAIDYWILLDTAVIKTFSGLWKICTEITVALHSNVICINVSASADVIAVRALIFLGLFFVCGAIACIVLKLFVLKEKKELLYGATGLLILAGIFLIAGFGVYHARIFKPIENSKVTLHAGFAFCIIAWLLTWAGAAICAAMVLMARKESPNLGI